MNQRLKSKNWNYKTLRWKHRANASWHWVWQWFLGYGIKDIGNKRKSRQIGLHENLQILVVKRQQKQTTQFQNGQMTWTDFLPNKIYNKYMKRCSRLWETVLCLVSQPYPTLCNPMDCRPPGSSVRADSSGKNTGMGSPAFFRGSSQPRDQTQFSHIAGSFFTF